MVDSITDSDGNLRDRRSMVGDVFRIYGRYGSSEQEGLPRGNRHWRKEETLEKMREHKLRVSESHDQKAVGRPDCFFH